MDRPQAALPKSNIDWIKFAARHFDLKGEFNSTSPWVCKHCGKEFDHYVTVLGLWLHIDGRHIDKLDIVGKPALELGSVNDMQGAKP